MPTGLMWRLVDVAGEMNAAGEIPQHFGPLPREFRAIAFGRNGTLPAVPRLREGLGVGRSGH